MQRFRHSKNGMVHDVEGIYTLYADVVAMKAKMIEKHLKIMQTARNHMELLREQLDIQ